MAKSPSQILEDSYTRMKDGGVTNVAKGGVAGVLSAISLALISGVMTLGDLVTKPLTGMAGGLTRTMESLTGGPADIIGPATRTTGLATQDWGLFAFAAGVGGTMLGVIVFNRAMNYAGTDLPFTDADIPLLGFVGADDED